MTQEIVGNTKFGSASGANNGFYDYYEEEGTYSSNTTLNKFQINAVSPQSSATVTLTKNRRIRVQASSIQNSSSAPNANITTTRNLKGVDFFFNGYFTAACTANGSSSSVINGSVLLLKDTTTALTVISSSVVRDAPWTNGGGFWCRGYWVGNILHYETGNSEASDATGTIDFEDDPCYIRMRASKGSGSTAQSMNWYMGLINIGKLDNNRRVL